MVANPFSGLEDRKLMLKYKAGESMAFDILYSRHKDRVYSYLQKRLHDQSDIDDLFQKVFVKFHKSRSLYQEKYDVLPWIYTITKSEFLDHIKRKKTKYEQFSEEFKEEQHSLIESEPVHTMDLDSEKSLSENERKALKERYYNEQSFEEISLLLETSQANTRKLISRGIKKLKKKYLGGSK